MAQLPALVLGLAAVLLAGDVRPARAQTPTRERACFGARVFLAFEVGRRIPPSVRFQDDDIRRMVEERLALRMRYRPNLPAEIGPDEVQVGVREKQRRHEAYLIGVIGTSDVAGAATERARGAELAYEWEGYSDGPLREARDAETYLEHQPTTPLRPALEVFLLHRYRCAMEAGDYEQDPRVMAEASAGYSRVWSRSRPTFDAVTAAIADDIDSAPSGVPHPRTYRPPADGGAAGSLRPPRPELIGALYTGRLPRQQALMRLEPAVRASVEARVRFRAAYKPRNVDSSGTEKTGPHRWLEGMLVAAAGSRRAAPPAAAYARTAVLIYEYEGYSDGPLDEAAHAEGYLARHPHSVLRPGLELFLLERYRAAFEAADYEGNVPAMTRAATAYRAVWGRLDVVRDPVVRAVAGELDAALQVYMRSAEHPRSFGR